MHTTLFTNCCGHVFICVDIVVSVVYNRNSTARMVVWQARNWKVKPLRSYACIDSLAIQSDFNKCRLSDIAIILAICYINFRRFDT